MGHGANSGWTLSFSAPADLSDHFESELEVLGGAWTTGVPDETGLLAVILYLESQPDSSALAALMADAAAAAGAAVPEFCLAALPERDWVAESQSALPPIHAGRFYLYGSHVSESPPVASIAIRIDANAAFGTGRHETTRGCLLALSQLARARRVRRPLDMGCGSGVLAIAMAKLWAVPVLAADNDPTAIAVARTNARLNGVASRLHAINCDGYRNRVLARRAPYDLIVANILAEPLSAMAGDLARNLMPGGFAVLSGLLTQQARQVFARHRSAGLCLVARIRLGEWTTLVLVKPNANAAVPSWVPPRCERQWTLQE